MQRAKRAAFISAGILSCSALVLYYRIYQHKKNKEQRSVLKFDYTVEQIEHLTAKLLSYWESVENEVATVLEPTYATTAGRLNQLEMDLSIQITNVTFIKNVGTVKEIRDAASTAQERINNYEVQSSMRNDVYQVIKKLSLNSTEMKQLNTEQHRYVMRLVRDYERNGLHLSSKKQLEIKEMKQRLSKLSLEFQQHLIEEDTILYFSKAELDGMSGEFLDSLSYSDSDELYAVSLKYPQVFPLLKRCKVATTRKKVEMAFNQRCINTNVPIIEEMIALRSKVSKLLGFKNHAEYILSIRMAETPTKVNKFLNDLNDKLEPLAKKELDALIRLKEADCNSSGKAFDGKINMYDFRYYMEEYIKEHYSIDHDELRQYFPIDIVTENLLRMYEQLLSLKFLEIENPHVWHQDVQMYSVLDTRHEQTKLIGYFYLDLFPRPGKYGHAACFGLIPGCLKPDGERQLPIAAMVANFSAPTATTPSLLQHNEVVTYFHEFGHVMHQICSETELGRFAGTAVERDFVEAPSQMLENWCWEKESLLRLCGHYKNPQQKIPEEMLDRLINSRNAMPGLLNKRQILFAAFDQRVHTSSKAATAKILTELHREILLMDMTPNTNFAASFGHIAGGYDAQYYGYLWSEVFSMDMFMTKFSGQIMNPQIGQEYREKILSRGGSVDAKEMLGSFLGREPNDKAFLESKGLSKM